MNLEPKSKVVAALSDGRRIDIEVLNRGFDEKVSCYVTEFFFDGTSLRSNFFTRFHEPLVCPEPELRIVDDEEYLRDALQLRFGVYVDDIEINGDA